MVSRNLERANENDGFEMTALEIRLRQASFGSEPIYINNIGVDRLVWTHIREDK